MTTNHKLINQTSGNTEHYSPIDILDLARRVLGKIELDPASSGIANRAVGATNIFTAADDGMAQDWIADTLWMNPPFSRGELPCKPKPKCRKKTCKDRGHCCTVREYSTKDWTHKLESEYSKGNVKEAIVITFANMSESFMTPLNQHPQCFPEGRINYMRPDGTINKGSPKGSVITYMGNNLALFKSVFSEIGAVKVLA